MGGPPCQIDVKLQKIEGRKSATMKDRNGESYKAPVFMVSFVTNISSLIAKKYIKKGMVTSSLENIID